MLADCVEKCPDDLWTTPSLLTRDGNRVIVRSFWRVSLHAAFFTQLYLGQDTKAFQPWPDRRQDATNLLEDPIEIEPYELSEDAEPYSKVETVRYIAYIRSITDATVDGLDLETSESGFPWYESISKLSHQLMNLRHLQGHVGQLSEILLARRIDTAWISDHR